MGLGATATHFGVGRHTYYLSFEDSIQANKWNTIAQVPLTLSTTFARASICLFLLRLFTINIAWRRILYLVNGLNIISGLVASTTILSACRPVGKIWNPEAPGTCRAPNINNGLSLFQGGKLPTFLEACASLANNETKPCQCFAIGCLRSYQYSSYGMSNSASGSRLEYALLRDWVFCK